MPMLELQGLTRRFGAVTAVDAVTLAVPDGQMVGVVVVRPDLSADDDAARDRGVGRGLSRVREARHRGSDRIGHPGGTRADLQQRLDTL